MRLLFQQFTLIACHFISKNAKLGNGCSIHEYF